MSAGGFEGRSLSGPQSLTGGGLQQQGSLDWVKLAGSSVNFTVDVLARMSAAGVEALTVCAAEAILSRLKLGRIGESRVQEAVLQLKAFSSMNNALWFGFGVKHVIKKLAESSEGLCCIAVCASLSEFYSTVDTARILRELFSQYNAPLNLTPALRQWTNLVEACEGALSATTFPVLIREITRLYLPDGSFGLKSRSEPAAIAKALNGLVQVSNGSLESVQFLGGADCGWIAAFAHWLLDLSVEIRDTTGETLYRPATINSSKRRDPQVVIIFGGSTTADLQLVGRIFVVPSGQSLVRGNESTQGDALSYGRVQWDCVIQDVFGAPFKAMLHGDLAILCGTALGCAARIFTSFVTDDEEIHSDKWSSIRLAWTYVNMGSHGRGFLNTVRQWLPELGQSQALMDSMEHNLSRTFEEAINEYQHAINELAASCSCFACQPSVPTHPQHQPFCQAILVETIGDLVQIASALDMKTKVLPTRCGVEGLYWKRLKDERTEECFDCVADGLLTGRNRDPLLGAEVLLSGRQIFTPSTGQSALTSSGLCFYLDTLVSISADLEQCNLVHVVPGRIEWNGNLYEDVHDTPIEPYSPLGPQYYAIPGQIETLASGPNAEDTISLDLTCDLVVQESIKRYRDKSIMAAYRMATSGGRIMVPPHRVAAKLPRSLSAPDCRGRQCAEGGSFEVFSVKGEGLMVNRGEYPLKVPILRVLRKSIPAQWIAITNSAIIPADFGEPEWYDCILQSTQCFHCLSKQALRIRDMSETVTIVATL